MASISVGATVGDWTLESILRDRLWSQTSYATSDSQSARTGCIRLLPTFDAPHFDVLVPTATVDAASTLLSLLGPAEGNPYRRRR